MTNNTKSAGKNALVALAVLATTFCLRGQPGATAPDRLEFDVASIKPAAAGCPPACGLIGSTLGSAGYHAEGATLRSLMTIAYSVTDRQISGGPRWIENERFDIEAKADRPRGIDELHTMLAHLLEERFHLEVRRETRQESVWNLTVAEGGSKMPPHDPNDKNYPPIIAGWDSDNDGSVCASARGPNETMEYFAFSLSRNMKTTVIDKTGLSGRYDVNLRYMPDGANPRHADGTPAPYSSDCSDIFAALPRQLGLKLVAGKGTVEYLVVEHVEQPTAN
jgi:uncharacterized protein (TIGR03435 family)